MMAVSLISVNLHSPEAMPLDTTGSGFDSSFLEQETKVKNARQRRRENEWPKKPLTKQFLD
jgi:hypothetical protein